MNTEAFLRLLLTRPGAAFAAQRDALPELAAMTGCPQPPNHHSEGDVGAHTALALEVLADLPAAVNRFAGTALAAAGVRLSLPPRSLQQALAVLFHDVGKPLTMQRRDGALTYYGHEQVGAELAVAVCERLRVVEVAAGLGATVDTDGLAWLIRNHLFWLNTDLGRVTDRALRRRFVRDDGWDEDLRVLHWCDTLGARGPAGLPHVDTLVRAEALIAQVRARARRAAAAHDPVLDGREVMAVLDLAPGPAVGAVLAWVRDRTADPAEARRLLRRHGAEVAAAAGRRE